jgi:hypothetical protein
VAKASVTKAGKVKGPTAPESAPVTSEMGKAFQKGICLRLILGNPSFKRKVDSDEITAGDADTDMLHVSKDTLQCDEFDAIQRFHGEIKKFLVIRSLTIKVKLLKGTYFIPTELAEEVFQKLEKDVEHHDTVLVPAFMKAYKTAKAEAKRRLKKLYDERDYPSEDALSKAFYIEHFPLTLSVDGKLEDIDKQLFRKMVERLDRTYERAAMDMRMGMRSQLRDMIAHLSERLSGTTDDGKPKIFRESAIQHINDYIQFFKPKNATDDIELARLVEKCQKVMTGVDVEALRDDATFRASMAKEMTTLKTALDSLVVAAPSRRVKLPPKKAVAA